MAEPREILALYDQEIRRDPVAEPGYRVERVGPVVRVVGPDGWVIYSDLTDANVRETVASQAEFFRHAGIDVEWKWFGHDRPPGLPAALEAEGFLPEEPETIVVFDLQHDLPRGTLPDDTEIRRVTDASGLRDAEAANTAAFGPPAHPFLAPWTQRLNDPNIGLFVAYVHGTPIASGRVEMIPGRSFAGLWGGGTAPAHRHRGIYRGLVAARAELARASGSRYLTVDARETSRPILERLGFVPLTTTRAWVIRNAPAEGTGAPVGAA
jgi:GNAT superfamily N-acetyltransferase